MKHAHYLAKAYELAAKSRDASNQNGALIVSNRGRINAIGWNRFPYGVNFTTERAESRPQKYRYFEHAERDAIYHAAGRGCRLVNRTMYCPWAACCDCARAIVGTRLKRLVVHKQRMELTPERWQEDVQAAWEMLSEAGVELVQYDGPIDWDVVTVNGRLWSPKTAEFVSEPCMA